MAKVPPPKRGKGKGEPPQQGKETTKGNLTKPGAGDLANLNFKVPVEFKREFKVAAASLDLSQVDFLKQIFEYWSREQK